MKTQAMLWGMTIVGWSSLISLNLWGSIAATVVCIVASMGAVLLVVETSPVDG